MGASPPRCAGPPWGRGPSAPRPWRLPPPCGGCGPRTLGGCAPGPGAAMGPTRAACPLAPVGGISCSARWPRCAGPLCPLRVPPCAGAPAPARVPVGALAPPPLRGPRPSLGSLASLARPGPCASPPRSLARPVCAAVRLRGRSLAPLPRPCRRCAAGSLLGRPCFASGASVGLRVAPRGVFGLPSVGFVPRPGFAAPRASGPAAPAPAPPAAAPPFFPLRGPGRCCARGLPRLLGASPWVLRCGLRSPLRPPPAAPAGGSGCPGPVWVGFAPRCVGRLFAAPLAAPPGPLRGPRCGCSAAVDSPKIVNRVLHGVCARRRFSHCPASVKASHRLALARFALLGLRP